MAAPAGSGSAAVQAWYDEVHNPGYDFSIHQTPATGHFSQLVWKATSYIGAARSADGVYIVANYAPPGNFAGEYPSNVLPCATPHQSAEATQQQQQVLEGIEQTILVLDASIDTVPDPRTAWDIVLRNDIAIALGSTPDRFRVAAVQAGSIVVHLEVLPGSQGEPTAKELVAMLTAAVADPSSQLYSGRVTADLNPAKTREQAECEAAAWVMHQAAANAAPYSQGADGGCFQGPPQDHPNAAAASEPWFRGNGGSSADSANHTGAANATAAPYFQGSNGEWFKGTPGAPLDPPANVVIPGPWFRGKDGNWTEEVNDPAAGAGFDGPWFRGEQVPAHHPHPTPRGGGWFKGEPAAPEAPTENGGQCQGEPVAPDHVHAAGPSWFTGVDGNVSEAAILHSVEAAETAEAIFEQVDDNQDGKITENEFAFWSIQNPQKAEVFFAFLDENDFQNGDVVSFKDKVGVFWLKAVMEFDDNVDMKLDKAEFCALHVNLAMTARLANGSKTEGANDTTETTNLEHRPSPTQPEHQTGWIKETNPALQTVAWSRDPLCRPLPMPTTPPRLQQHTDWSTPAVGSSPWAESPMSPLQEFHTPHSAPRSAAPKQWDAPIGLTWARLAECVR